MKNPCIRFALVALLFMFCVFYSCAMAFSEDGSGVCERFDWHHGGQASMIVDKKTGVCYLWVNTYYEGGICPMYNADGSLVVWEEEQRVQHP